MSLPDANVTPQDGGLGLAAEGIQGIHCKIGLSSKGTENQVFGFSSPEQIVEKLGHGPLVNALADAFAAGARIVYAIRGSSAVDGAASAVQADAGNAGDGSLAVAAASKPYDRYNVVIEILYGGDLNEATFRYSLDGGDTWSDPITVPTGAPGTYDIPDTGITLEWTEGATPAADPPSFAAGDKWTFTTTAPKMSTVTVGDAVDVAIASPIAFEFQHIVGESDSALWTAVGTKMGAAAVNHEFTFAICETDYVADGESKADWVGSLGQESVGYADTRIAVSAGWAEMVCPLTGRTVVRNTAGLLTGWLAKLRKVSLSAGRVREGSLPAITRLMPADINEADILALDQARYITVRSFKGMAGFYFTNARMMASQVSDYRWLEWRRVMDLVCRDVRHAELQSIHDEATDASLAALRADMQRPVDRRKAQGIITDGKVRIPPGQDIIGTSTLETEVGIVPIGTIRTINTGIKFVRSV